MSTSSSHTVATSKNGIKTVTERGCGVGWVEQAVGPESPFVMNAQVNVDG